MKMQRRIIRVLCCVVQRREIQISHHRAQKILNPASESPLSKLNINVNSLQKNIQQALLAQEMKISRTSFNKLRPSNSKRVLNTKKTTETMLTLPSGAAEARRAHNPEVPRSKLGVAKFLYFLTHFIWSYSKIFVFLCCILVLCYFLLCRVVFYCVVLCCLFLCWIVFSCLFFCHPSKTGRVFLA